MYERMKGRDRLECDERADDTVRLTVAVGGNKSHGEQTRFSPDRGRRRWPPTRSDITDASHVMFHTDPGS